MYLFWAVLSLRCCASLWLRWLLLLWSTDFSSYAHGLSSCSFPALEHRFKSCGAQAKLLHSTWDLPGPRIKPVSLALQDRFLTTGPPWKPLLYVFIHILYQVKVPFYHEWMLNFIMLFFCICYHALFLHLLIWSYMVLYICMYSYIYITTYDLIIWSLNVINQMYRYENIKEPLNSFDSNLISACYLFSCAVRFS